MDATDRNYLVSLARELAETETAVTRGSEMLVVYRRRIGERLNAIYGESPIPFAEKEEIQLIFGREFSATVISQVRRLAAQTRDEDEARDLAADYGGWTGVAKGFLTGRSPAQTGELVGGARAKIKTTAHIAKHTHYVRDALVRDGGLSTDEAVEALEIYLDNLDWRQVKAAYDHYQERS